MAYGYGGTKKKTSGMKKKTGKKGPVPKGMHRMPNGRLMMGSSHGAYMKKKKKK
jgi:hypothetical protein